MGSWNGGRRLVYLRLLFVTCITIFTITRLGLLLYSSVVLGSFSLEWHQVVQALAAGFVNDLLTLTYAAVPFATYVLLIPSRLFQARWHQGMLMAVYTAVVCLLAVVAIAEFLFWDEFGSRFNFISVDYLVYRNEVAGNIAESYPVTWLLLLAGVVAVLATLVVRRHLLPDTGAAQDEPRRLTRLTLVHGLAVLCFLFVNDSVHANNTNHYLEELGLNGIYEFFHAFNANELNYRENYVVGDDRELSQRLRRMVGGRTDADGYDLRRQVKTPGKSNRKNVILVVIESLSAKYVGYLGSKLQLTPHLDQLAGSSLRFDRFYATGTRTVRALEAITLSIPPTPGSSIVKRPDHSGFFNIGTVFRNQGYATRFIYGGFGYFDNMNEFFASNGFQVVDRSDFAADEIGFSNIWGVADEDLYRRTLREADAASATEKPFFFLLLTTSNHRPFTYPEGRIDIASGSGRYGAVKYTDHAIGEFLARAKQHEWFKDTVFVLVADHNASSAGEAELDASQYHIPLLVYGQDITPGAIDTMASQIDLAPTLLSLLGFDYESRFFGSDMVRMRPGTGRALVGNYQKLGLLTQDQLVILSPEHGLELMRHPFQTPSVEPLSPLDPKALDALAWYQGADFAYKHGLLKE